MRGHVPQHPTYPEEVEADGEVRLPVAVPVPGLLEQGHQHAARHREHPALLGPPDGQQELRVPPKCVSGWKQQVRQVLSSASMWLPQH